MSAPDLVLAGNLIVDDIVFEDGRTRLGEPGGAVIYAALGAALWGLRVGVVSLRGEDYPEWMLDALALRGVSLDGVHALDGPGVRAWLLHEQGRRQILHRLDRPTHLQASPGVEHVPGAWLGAAWFHLTPAPLEAQQPLAAGLRARGAAAVALDPHVPLREDTLPAWRALLPLLDALFVGVDEMRLPGAGDDPRPALRGLAAGRLRLLVCKRGARGGLLYDAQHGREHAWAAAPAATIDPTGAGDAFAGGFLAGRLLGDDLDAALRRGAVSAAFAVEDWGARGLLQATRDRAERRLPHDAAGTGSPGGAQGSPPRLRVADEVAAAVQAGRPVVALETTLVTHGLPRPDGLRVARELEDEVRAAGAWPATIGVLDGALRVGLTRAELQALAESPEVAKLNLGNLAAQVACGAPGSTTVAATLFAAWRAGLRVVATGGMGGVHRGASESDDVSADLTALARFPVALVCSGAKAVLDLPRTRERLETLGVPVFGFATDAFPAFYRRDSGLPIDRRFDDVAALAEAVRAHFLLDLGTGVVVANPIPAEHELPEDVCARAIDDALVAARGAGVHGRDVTPFLLERLRVLTGGRSLGANVALLRANARLAAQLAVALGGLRGAASQSPPGLD